MLAWGYAIVKKLSYYSLQVYIYKYATAEQTYTIASICDFKYGQCIK